MRRDLLPYFGLPFYRAMLERSGFEADIAAYDEAAARGDGEGMQAGISERFLRALCAVGSPDDVRAGVARYQDAGANVAVRGTGRQDRLRGDAARGRARLATRPRPTARRTTPATRQRGWSALVRPRRPGGTARR